MCECMCVPMSLLFVCVSMTMEARKGHLGPLELELQGVVNFPILVLGSKVNMTRRGSLE